MSEDKTVFRLSANMVEISIEHEIPKAESMLRNCGDCKHLFNQIDEEPCYSCKHPENQNWVKKVW